MTKKTKKDKKSDPPISGLIDITRRKFRWSDYLAEKIIKGTAFLSITLIPPLIATFVKGRIRTENENPVQRRLLAWYRPVLKWSLHHAKLVVGGAFLLIILSGFAFTRLGSEFMPSLWEGD